MGLCSLGNSKRLCFSFDVHLKLPQKPVKQKHTQIWLHSRHSLPVTLCQVADEAVFL